MQKDRDTYYSKVGRVIYTRPEVNLTRANIQNETGDGLYFTNTENKSLIVSNL
jgi:hypothetical protein